MPIYEEHAARLERNISIEDWMKLPELEKALIVAMRRIRIQMANLQQEAEIKHMNRKRK